VRPNPSGTKTADEPPPAKLPQTLGSLLARGQASAHAAAVPTMRGAASDHDVIDVNGVVRLLRVGRNKVYELVARNQIPHRRVGKQIRFSRDAIMRWLDPWSSQDAKEGH